MNRDSRKQNSILAECEAREAILCFSPGLTEGTVDGSDFPVDGNLNFVSTVLRRGNVSGGGGGGGSGVRGVGVGLGGAGRGTTKITII